MPVAWPPGSSNASNSAAFASAQAIGRWNSADAAIAEYASRATACALNTGARGPSPAPVSMRGSASPGLPSGLAKAHWCPALRRICQGTPVSVGSKSVSGMGMRILAIGRAAYRCSGSWSLPWRDVECRPAMERDFDRRGAALVGAEALLGSIDCVFGAGTQPLDADRLRARCPAGNEHELEIVTAAERFGDEHVGIFGARQQRSGRYRLRRADGERLAEVTGAHDSALDA